MYNTLRINCGSSPAVKKDVLNVEKPVYVIGHRNPDTDSVCSAVAYAWLKRQLGCNAVAARAGALNPETQFVLDYFGVEEPVLIEDMYPRLKDVELIAVPVLNGETKLREVSHLFNEYGVRCMPVGTPDNIEGVVTVTDLAKCFYKELCAQENESGAVDYSQLLDAPVKDIMTASVVAFDNNELLDDVKTAMLDTNFRSYPVKENGRYIGMIDKVSLLKPAKQQLILVDHNERAQAVEGSEEAEIIEIIDHHRLGGLRTAAPIYIREEPVGCTATIITNMAEMYGLELPREIAGLLLSAIISDTLYFRSPTTTQLDKDAAAKLQKIAGLEELEAYAMEELKQGSVIARLSADELVRTDLKEFDFGDVKASVAQINILGRQQGLDKAAELLTALDAMREAENYDLSLLMVTDILSEATDLLVAGVNQAKVTEAFGQPETAGHYYLPGVLSRKKQIIPPLTDAYNK